MAFIPAATPETTGQLVVRSLKLYKSIFVYVVLLALLSSVCAFIPRLMGLLVGENIFIILPALSPYRLWLIVPDIINVLIFTAILWQTNCVSIKKRCTVLESFRQALKKFPAVLVAVVVLWIIFFLINLGFLGFYSLLSHKETVMTLQTNGTLISSIGLAVQLILGIFLMVLFFFYIPLVLLENKTITGALTKSARLVWGYWFRTVFLQLIPWACYLVALIIIKYVALLPVHIYFFPAEPRTLFGTVVNLIIFALFIPWFASMMLTQLHDLELRKKNLDK